MGRMKLAGWLDASSSEPHSAFWLQSCEPRKEHCPRRGRLCVTSWATGWRTSWAAVWRPSTVPTLQRLLRQPDLLLDLQNLILHEGGSCWDRLAKEDADLNEQVERDRRRVAGSAPSRHTWQTSPSSRDVLSSADVRRPGDRGCGLGAGLRPRPGGLAALGTKRHEGEFLGGRLGLGSLSAIPASGSGSAYYDKLADAADEWSHDRPESRPDLARRLGEFRVGCSLLLLDPHEPLKKHEGEEDWLVNRCRRWAARLDELMATTDAGEEPVDKLRAEADELVRRVTLRSHDPGPTTYVPWNPAEVGRCRWPTSIPSVRVGTGRRD